MDKNQFHLKMSRMKYLTWLGQQIHTELRYRTYLIGGYSIYFLFLHLIPPTVL